MTTAPRCVLQLGPGLESSELLLKTVGAQRARVADMGWASPDCRIKEIEDLREFMGGLGRVKGAMVFVRDPSLLAGSTEMLSALEDIVEGWDLTIVVLAPDPLLYLEELFIRGVQTGRGSEDIPTFLENSIRAPEKVYGTYLKEIVERFGTDCVERVPMSGAEILRGRSLVTQFSTSARLPDELIDATVAPPHDRKLVDVETALLLSMLRNVYGVPQRKMRELIRRALAHPERFEQAQPSPSTLWTDDEARAIEDQSRSHYIDFLGSHPAAATAPGTDRRPTSVLREPYDSILHLTRR